jgi:hypothetical protein
MTLARYVDNACSLYFQRYVRVTNLSTAILSFP